MANIVEQQQSTLLANLLPIKHIILVLSGKGGVGKSSVSAQLALSLAHAGCRVGVLDVDLTGPSIPQMLGLDGNQVHQASTGWVPVYTDASQRLCCMSIGFLLQNKNDSVVWRGPKKNAMIRQFLSDVCWGELDYLIIDTPPGTSDEHISVAEYLKEANPDGAVLVTTPQAVALADVRKELNFCKTVNIPILGVVENMSGFVCPHCQECTNVFSSGGGEAMANEFSVEFLGRIPIDPSVTTLFEQRGASEELVRRYSETNMFKVFYPIAEKVVAKAAESKTQNQPVTVQ